jgi:hypothetical protein
MQTNSSRPAPVTGTPRPLTLLATLAVAIGLTALAPAAQAQAPAEACGDAATLLKNAYPGARPDPDKTSFLLGERRLMMPGQPSGDAPSMVCKVWPAHDKLLLVAVPSMDVKQALDNDRVGNLDILVVDRGSLKVQQRLTLPDAMSDDAIRIESLEFDTARYVIAPGVQAFGLRTTRNGASRANPFNEVSLHLFALGAGNTGPLRVVLDGLSVDRMSGEWDTSCVGQYTQHKAVLTMSTDVHNGFFDIRASKSSEDSKATLVKNGNDCKETVFNKQKTQYTLAYDGKQYPVPKELKGM